MGLWLNKKLAVFLLCFLAGNFIFAQIGTEPTVYKDYKDPEQFDNFYRRRQTISAWQINKLKTGALVVKLRTDRPVIEALTKAGNKPMAEKKRLERLAINITISRAFRYNYNFSKVYFIYTSSNDSLLKGKRSGIFLDSNLVIDPSIIMTEDFYLISESDDIYNSSIGFVKEDSAKYISEKGSKSTLDAGIVIKNKYGHQLKKPFPYTYYITPFKRINAFEYISFRDTLLVLNVGGAFPPSNKNTYTYSGTKIKLYIPYDFTYKLFSYFVSDLNYNFTMFLRESLMPSEERLNAVKPYLY